jgi:hypothetical protein
VSFRGKSVGDVGYVLVVTVAMVVAGAVAGAIWVLIAPPATAVAIVTRSGKRAHGYVGNDGEHFFDSAVMMAGLLFVLGVVSAVLLWQWRSRRGPTTVVALFTGGVAAAGTAAGVGAGLARLSYGHTDIGSVPADQKIHYITEAPSVFFGHTPIQILVGLVLPSAAAALTYAVIAAASADDDLGVGTPVAQAVDSRVG